MEGHKINERFLQILWPPSAEARLQRVTLNRFLITTGQQQNAVCSQNKNLPPGRKGSVTSYISFFIFCCFVFYLFWPHHNQSIRPQQVFGIQILCVCLIVSLPQNGGRPGGEASRNKEAKCATATHLGDGQDGRLRRKRRPKAEEHDGGIPLPPAQTLI